MNQLKVYLESVPGVSVLSTGEEPDGHWFVKLGIDVAHPLASRVVKELAHVLNDLSIEERPRTQFHPVPPAPTMHGAPDTFSSWVITCEVAELKPAQVHEWHYGHLPRPVAEPEVWQIVAKGD